MAQSYEIGMGEGRSQAEVSLASLKDSLSNDTGVEVSVYCVKELIAESKEKMLKAQRMKDELNAKRHEGAFQALTLLLVRSAEEGKPNAA